MFYVLFFLCMLKESTIHGIRYFVDGENKLHRVVWVFLVFCSVGFLTYLIEDAYRFVQCLKDRNFKVFLRGWDDDPATSTIERVKLSELDFPAITICPEFATDALATRNIYNKYLHIIFNIIISLP